MESYPNSSGAPIAAVLLSGGLDSMVTAALAKEQGFEVHALSVDYGQRHRLELASAKRIAKMASGMTFPSLMFQRAILYSLP